MRDYRSGLWEFGETDTGEDQWRQLIVDREVPNRFYSRIAYDRTRKRTVIKGGFFVGADTPFVHAPTFTTRDVWEWRYFLPDPTCSLGRQ